MSDLLRRVVMNVVTGQLELEKKRIESLLEIENRGTADLNARLRGTMDEMAKLEIDRKKTQLELERARVDSENNTGREMVKYRSGLEEGMKLIEQRCNEAVAALRRESVNENASRTSEELKLFQALQAIMQAQMPGVSASPQPMQQANTDSFRNDVDAWSRIVETRNAESTGRLASLESRVQLMGNTINGLDAGRTGSDNRVFGLEQAMGGISAQLEESNAIKARVDRVREEYTALHGVVGEHTAHISGLMVTDLAIEARVEQMEQPMDDIKNNLSALSLFLSPGFYSDDGTFEFEDTAEERLLRLVGERFQPTSNQEQEEANRAEVMNRETIMELIATQLRLLRVDAQGALTVVRKRRPNDDEPASPAARQRTGDAAAFPQTPSPAASPLPGHRTHSEQMEARLRSLENEVRLLREQNTTDAGDIYARPPPPGDGTANYLRPAP
jgi:hypothetical protein